MQKCRDTLQKHQPLQWRDGEIRKESLNDDKPASGGSALEPGTSRRAVKKKSLLRTYSDIRSAIAFIMRNERGLSKHTITEAALAATKIIHGRDVQLNVPTAKQ